MKKMLFGMAFLAFLSSCETKVAGTQENSDSHKAIADKNAASTSVVYKAIETGDVSALDSLFTTDVVDHNGGPQGQDIKGKDSVIAMLATIHNYFDGLKLEMVHHATSADGVYHYSTVRMTGTSKENPWGMPVGMKMDDTSVDVMKLKDGKCTDHWSFMSMGDFNEIMGMMHNTSDKPAEKKK